MPQEQLFQRRRQAGEGADASSSQADQYVAQGRVIDLGAYAQAVYLQVVHSGHAVQTDRHGHFSIDSVSGQMTHLGQRSGVDGAAVTDDRHPVRQRLGLGQDVARQQR